MSFDLGGEASPPRGHVTDPSSNVAPVSPSRLRQPGWAAKGSHPRVDAKPNDRNDRTHVASKPSSRGSGGTLSLPSIHAARSESEHKPLTAGRMKGNVVPHRPPRRTVDPPGGAFNGAVTRKNPAHAQDATSPSRVPNPMMLIEAPEELIAKAESAKQLVVRLKRCVVCL